MTPEQKVAEFEGTLYHLRLKILQDRRIPPDVKEGLIAIIDRAPRPVPDFLSQALNEGDGVYRP